jgi:3' terminal RNA ribose 2'-O-methyltransferase Hen1
VDARPVPLDPEIPEWGDSRYVDLRLEGEIRLADALNHLYVLLPVLDDAKHYWVGSDEIEKLIRAGEGWLATHPDKELISRRYLAHRRNLTDTALERLTEVDGDLLEDEPAAEVGDDLQAADQPVSLAVQRRTAVLEVLREVGGRRVGDLGCGEGVLVGELLKDGRYDQVVATDVSARALGFAERRLHVADMSDRQRERLRLFQSSVTYADARLAGLDAAVLMEVVEHVDPPRLPALAQAVFGSARPGAVVVTTPNSEHNVRFPSLPAGAFRHPDHRFEWTRAEFQDWAQGVCRSYGYEVEFRPVGPDDPEVGPPTQLALFRLKEAV